MKAFLQILLCATFSMGEISNVSVTLSNNYVSRGTILSQNDSAFRFQSSSSSTAIDCKYINVKKIRTSNFEFKAPLNRAMLDAVDNAIVKKSVANTQIKNQDKIDSVKNLISVNPKTITVNPVIHDSTDNQSVDKSLQSTGKLIVRIANDYGKAISKTIYVDGEYVGDDEIELDLSPGRHTISLFSDAQISFAMGRQYSSASTFVAGGTVDAAIVSGAASLIGSAIQENRNGMNGREATKIISSVATIGIKPGSTKILQFYTPCDVGGNNECDDNEWTYGYKFQN